MIKIFECVKRVAVATWQLHVTLCRQEQYRKNKTHLDNCRVVDVMGDTLYYDFRMW